MNYARGIVYASESEVKAETTLVQGGVGLDLCK